MFGLHVPELIVAAFVLLFVVGVHAILLGWGRWVARRHHNAAHWRLASWLPLLACAVGVGTLVLSLVDLYSVVQHVNTADKPEVLHRAMHQMMVATYVGLPLSMLIDFAATVFFVIGSSRTASEAESTRMTASLSS